MNQRLAFLAQYLLIQELSSKHLAKHEVQASSLRFVLLWKVDLPMLFADYEFLFRTVHSAGITHDH